MNIYKGMRFHQFEMVNGYSQNGDVLGHAIMVKEKPTARRPEEV